MSVPQETKPRPAASQPAGARFTTRLAGASGRTLHVDGHWRPVIGLGEGALRGHILHLDVREDLSAMSTRAIDLATLNTIDLERIDLAAAEHGLAVLPPSDSDGQPPLAFLGASWSTARAPRARRKLLQLAASAQVRLRTLPVCEIHGLER